MQKTQNIIETTFEIELSKEEKQNFIKGKKAKIGDEIDVNDYAVCKIVKKSRYLAQLVIETDGCVRWYINPNDRDDIIIKSVSVKKIRER
jgi:hypothetical protein